MRPIRVLLTDDHALFRAGMRALLQSIDGIQVVAEATDGREALELIPVHHPDIVLMDIAMQGMSGLQTTEQITRDHPQVRVIVLSMHAQEEFVVQAIRAGAAGYLLKDADPAELEMALKAVSQGGTYLSPPVAKHLMAAYTRGHGALSPLDNLTLRQREILQLVAEGRSTKEIGGLLDISAKTVETHRAHLMDKLDIHEVAGLVRFAIRVGLVSQDQ